MPTRTFNFNCKDCGIDLDDTNTDYNQNGYARNICKSCKNIKNNIRNKAQYKPERAKANKLKTKYGISLLIYNQLLELQGGICAICRNGNSVNQPMYVDHDHETGIVRGLLCQKCNHAIGLFNENENIFWNAMEYLKKHKWSKVS